MASEIIGMTGFFITLIVFISMYFRTRHIERMELIKHGKPATIFKIGAKDTNSALKLGLLLLSIGFGLLIGLFVDYMFNTEPAGVFVCILILGGMSLIFYHLYMEKKMKDDDKEEDIMV